MSMTSPVDRFLAIDEELRQLENNVRRCDQIIRIFDDLLALGELIVENPQLVRGILLGDRENCQTAMNNRVFILLCGDSSLETSR
jgi:hypothetical protein